MDRSQFAIVSMLVTFAMIAIISFVAWWRQRTYVPGRKNYWPGYAFLLTLAISFAAIVYDGKEHGGYAEVDAQRALGLPAGMQLDYPMLGQDSCTHDERHFRMEQSFPGLEAMRRWRAEASDLSRMMAYLTGYYGMPESAFEVRDGSFDWQRIDHKYDLQNSGYWSPERFRYYKNELVCADIYRAEPGQERFVLVPCDPAAQPGPEGTLGRVAFVLDDEKRSYALDIDHLTISARCTNPVRRAVNGMLGLPHPR